MPLISLTMADYDQINSSYKSVYKAWTNFPDKMDYEAEYCSREYSFSALY